MTEPKKLAEIEAVIFESELIKTVSDMEMLLSQEGISITDNSHLNEYLQEVAASPVLSDSLEESLVQRLLDGDISAKTELVEANLRLVLCAAKRYFGRGMQFFDIVQEGSLGLVTAAEEYCENNGSFRSFAAAMILAAIENALSEAEASSQIPDRLTELLTKISRSDIMLEEKLGREATPEEIAADTGVSLDEVTAVMELMEDVAAHESDREKPDISDTKK